MRLETGVIVQYSRFHSLRSVSRSPMRDNFQNKLLRSESLSRPGYRVFKSIYTQGVNEQQVQVNALQYMIFTANRVKMQNV